eukprot:1481336-Amphidinium_carterae.2
MDHPGKASKKGDLEAMISAVNANLPNNRAYRSLVWVSEVKFRHAAVVLQQCHICNASPPSSL